MSLPYIRDVFRVPARYGATVTLADGVIGTIVGSDGDYLQVEFHKGTRVYIHPTDVTFTKGTK